MRKHLAAAIDAIVAVLRARTEAKKRKAASAISWG
ncbi:hypothetical protein BLJAPNOD_03839 [Ensifer sp. M14]|nr:hypothetical protein BLJAPNOD_03839 [Ensifer sp. M14]